MLDNRKRTKIKNYKIQGWRLELASFSYTITYRPGVDNVGPDTLNRAFCASVTETNSNLSKMHNGLCHPGVTRMLHFVRLNNLPYSTEEVKRVCSSCRICAELKPHFHRPSNRDSYQINTTCRSQKKLGNTSENVATMYAPTLCALGVTAAFSNSLSHAALPAVIDGVTVTALIDSCSSDSFINQQVANRLLLAISHTTRNISMALTTL